MKMFLLGMVGMYFLINVIIIMSLVPLVPLGSGLRKSTKQDRKKVFKIIIEILFFGTILTIIESLKY